MVCLVEVEVEVVARVVVCLALHLCLRVHLRLYQHQHQHQHWRQSPISSVATVHSGVVGAAAICLVRLLLHPPPCLRPCPCLCPHQQPRPMVCLEAVEMAVLAVGCLVHRQLLCLCLHRYPNPPPPTHSVAVVCLAHRRLLCPPQRLHPCQHQHRRQSPISSVATVHLGVVGVAAICLAQPHLPPPPPPFPCPCQHQHPHQPRYV